MPYSNKRAEAPDLVTGRSIPSEANSSPAADLFYERGYPPPALKLQQSNVFTALSSIHQAFDWDDTLSKLGC